MSNSGWFISVDWGTTNFRLRLVDKDSFTIHKEIKTNKGAKKVYSDFLKKKELNQHEFFLSYLKKEILKLPSKHRNHSIVISGMASSNIGMLELDYGVLPLSKDGKAIVSKKISINKSQNIYLISGIKGTDDIMRGEETQALGLIEYLDDDGVLLLPGTHCKHLTFSQGKYTGFRTFMTGELFDLLSKHSILSNTINFSEIGHDQNELAFKEGLRQAFKGNLTSNLFSIRAKNLLNIASKEDNYYYLSGLLIGDELSYLGNKFTTIYLAAPNTVSNLYKLAIQTILKNTKTITFSPKAIERALLLGQKKILSLYEN